MKRIILGKILFLLAISHAFAVNNAKVNKTQFYLGDVITLTISAESSKVLFPEIYNIAGFKIIGSGSSSVSNEYINGKISEISSQSYSFKPTKSLTIKAFNLEIDGKKKRTNPIKIKLLKRAKSKAGDDFILTIKANKTEYFLGEKIDLQVIIKQKKSIITKGNIQVEPLKTKGLIFKPSKNFARSKDANYNIYTQNNQVIANQTGTFDLPVIAAIIYPNNNSNIFAQPQRSTAKKIYSNTIQLKIKPLPDNLEIYGDFKITTSIDKSQVKAGKALNLSINIIGDGNLSDIEKFALTIENTTIYIDEPQIKNQQWTQKFAIVAQEDFVIPAFSFDFFDNHTQSKKTISTQKIKIKVQNPTPSNLQTPLLQLKVNNILKYYYLLIGFLVAALLLGLWVIFKRFNRHHKNQSLIKQIQSVRGDKQLFDLLLPLNIMTLKSVLQQLEGNLYKNQNHKINKKAIIKTLKL